MVLDPSKTTRNEIGKYSGFSIGDKEVVVREILAGYIAPGDFMTHVASKGRTQSYDPPPPPEDPEPPVRIPKPTDVLNI